MALEAGDRVGPYEILSVLGRGGMGEVCRARDARLNRDVAIKTSHEKFNERFLREARAIAALNHPNVCTLHDIGPDYLVMEFIEGSELKGPMQLDEALRVAGQIAAALEEAHRKGIVHRDLKPANVKITPNGTVKVLDFGLAKMRETSPDDATGTIGLTEAGVAIGTPAYMAPEQAQGNDVDKRVDVWAFGTLLYELLTGKQLFRRDSLQSTLSAVLTYEPDLAKAPRRVRRLLRACLVKDPRERLSNIGDWRLLLDDDAEERTASAPVLPWAVAVLCLVGAVSALVLLWPRPSPTSREKYLFQIQPPEGTAFDIYSRISPDGRKVAFTAIGSDNRASIWVRDLDSEYSRQLPGTYFDAVGYGSPFWSWDSKSIAYSDGNRLKRVDVSGSSPPRMIAETDSVLASGNWSSRGIILAGSLNSDGVVKLTDVGGAAVRLTPEGSTSPAFLPDETHFLYHRNGGPDVEGIYLGSIDLRPEEQSKERLIESSSGAVYTPSSASSNGYILFLDTSQTLRAQGFDPVKLKLVGDPIPIAENVGSSPPAGHFSVSSNGALTYRHGVGGRRRLLVWLDRHGNRVGTVGDPAFYGDNFRISPDGQRLAVDITANGNTDIYVLGLKDNSSTRLTFDAAPDLWSVWSLDGKSVLFRSERVPTGDIYQVPADGTGADKLFFHSDFAKFPLEWSPPDGKYLMFVDRQPKGDFDSRVFSPADGKAAPWLATSNLEWYQRISPDGRWVAYVSNETGGSEIFVRPFSGPARDGGLPAGGKWKVSETTGHLPHWRQDSRELFYITLSGDLMSVSLTAGPSFRAEPPKKLFALPPYSPFEVAENGARILALLPEQQSKSSPITVVLNWERLLKR